MHTITAGSTLPQLPHTCPRPPCPVSHSPCAVLPSPTPHLPTPLLAHLDNDAPTCTGRLWPSCQRLPAQHAARVHFTGILQQLSPAEHLFCWREGSIGLNRTHRNGWDSNIVINKPYLYISLIQVCSWMDSAWTLSTSLICIHCIILHGGFQTHSLSCVQEGCFINVLFSFSFLARFCWILLTCKNDTDALPFSPLLKCKQWHTKLFHFLHRAVT